MRRGRRFLSHLTTGYQLILTEEASAEVDGGHPPVLLFRGVTREMNDKPVDALTISDLRRYPVWEFDLSRACEPGRDETWVTPVETLPVADLANRLVGVEARMANGEPLLCLLGNIHLQHERKTRQFLTLTAYNTQGEHFFLARYFDSDDARQGPAALADFLGLSVTEVFPITYDISALATGLEAVCKGTIPLAATERLSDAALMALIFE